MHSHFHNHLLSSLRSRIETAAQSIVHHLRVHLLFLLMSLHLYRATDESDKSNDPLPVTAAVNDYRVPEGNALRGTSAAASSKVARAK